MAVTPRDEAKVAKGLRLAFGHQARVGKDTAAAHAIALHGGRTLSFAKPVYEIAGFIQQTVGRPIEKDGALLQWVGLGLREHYNENVWVDKVMAEIAAAAPAENLFITDMRFPNEMDALKKAGFTTIKIVRPDRPLDRNQKHLSEIALADANFDYEILNDSGVPAYIAKIDALLATLQN